ncbi:hypothetical protein BJ684DRAFT_18924 [Piptocephalis cylindrospora]|uniref:Uncharacterized protein n=1 Tax=Piptocephalis cylindrospora TaxID=1907219 RepID=A0A4P9Y788_9FUNG|nr:hypothetical protein BJ684DRAFT_18924 [Piptocephalis cylindrospora]|eukprot:RKP14682.1 hypothetical protein BJ684DRAFT_18924 [Piptocephalis cylindrospora]
MKAFVRRIVHLAGPVNQIAAQEASIDHALTLPLTRGNILKVRAAIRRLRAWAVEGRVTDRYLKTRLLRWVPLLESLMGKRECRPDLVSFLRALVVVRPMVAIETLEELVRPLMSWIIDPDKSYTTVPPTLLLTVTRASSHPGLFPPLVRMLKEIGAGSQGRMEEDLIIGQHVAWLLTEMLPVVAVEWMGGYWEEVEEGVSLCLSHVDGTVQRLGRRCLSTYRSLHPEGGVRLVKANASRGRRISYRPMSLELSTTSGRLTDLESNQGTPRQSDGLGYDPWDYPEIPQPPRTAAHPREYEWTDDGIHFTRQSTPHTDMETVSIPHTEQKEHEDGENSVIAQKSLVLTAEEPLSFKTHEPSSPVSYLEEELE